MFEAFKKRNIDVSRRRFRMEAKQVYEDECRRLINVVESLTEQRKESVEIIRLVNRGLSDLIGRLQKRYPKNDNVTPIPDELLNSVSSQLLISIQAQLDGELLDDESDAYAEGNEGNDGSRYNDDGLRTELVILQSQLNRLRTEQDKLATKVDSKQQRNTNGNGESSNHIHKRKGSTGLIDSFNLSEENMAGCDNNGAHAGKDDDPYEIIKKQEKEINKLRQKLKIYENQFKDYVNGTTSESHVNGIEEVRDEFEKLQQSFHKFTTVSGNEIEINKEAANALLKTYQLEIKDNSKSKMYLSAALEARISSLLNDKIEDYFAEAMKDAYLEEGYDDDNLEYDLVITTEKLAELLNRFADARVNGDDSLRKISVKLRSLIYSSLSTSSFSTKNDTHPLISSLITKLLKVMEEYRTLPSAESSQSKEEAKQIILGFISLVCFKLRSLDPRPRLFYYDQGTKVDENKMKGAWDKKSATNQEVEICYFPAIIVNQKNSGMISKAQVLTRPR